MSIQKEKPNKGNRGKAAIYSDSFKVQIALEYINGDYSCPQIANKYNIPVKSAEYFVHWYRKNHQNMAIEDPVELEDTSSNPKDIKELEKKLALAEMKIAALEKVIAIANEDYRTDLKKKAVTM